MDDIKVALDRAASSPDSAVRSMALAYKEMQVQLVSLGAFFSVYAEGMQGKPIPVAKGNPETIPVNRLKLVPVEKKPPVKNVKTDEFTQAIIGILQKSNAPIMGHPLQAAYEALNLEPPMQYESFRQRMHKRQINGDVVLHQRVGFWLPDQTLDQTEGEANGA